VVPLLIPIQQAEQIDGVANDDANALQLPVEEIIQNAPEEGAEEIQLPDEQVLAMDDDIDTDSNNFQPIQSPIPFPDFNNFQPLMPEEFPEEELMGYDNDNGQHNENDLNNIEIAQQPPQQPNGNIQIGLVQIQDIWPQKEMPTLSPQMFQHKSAPSGFEVGQSSKSSLPLDPFAPAFGSTGFMPDSTTSVPS
jgi:hypothetical protein